jgi:hypothetical protein
MKRSPALLGFLATTALADVAPIRNVVLTENLAHPPKLEICMKKVFPKGVTRFVGPIVAPDRLRVDYAAVGTDGAVYTWRFRPAIGASWRPFLYEDSLGTAVGVATTAMMPVAEIVPPERWRMPIAVDVRPCEAHFRSR